MPPLPEPSTPALEHSQAVYATIAREITANEGWLSFERFMELALYAPGLGYYSAGLDKFGAGHLSPADLARLPLTRVKTDLSLMAQLPETPEQGSAMRAVIAMAHGLGLKVTAKGVETPAQRDLLVALGCDEMQGFLFGGPVELSAFSPLFRNGFTPRRYENP